MKKVLIVEDHSIVIKGLKIIFEKEFVGYSPDIVSSMAEMMKALKNNDYHLVILDMQLEDGISLNIIPDVIKLYPSLAILIFTGYPEEVYAQRLFSYGVKGYLNKNSEERERSYTHCIPYSQVKLILVRIIKISSLEKMRTQIQQKTRLIYCHSGKWKLHYCCCREKEVQKYVQSLTFSQAQ